MFHNAGVVCFIFCFGSTPDVKAPISEYCQVYERQVLTKDELAAVRKLPKALQKRIQGNDLDYLCRCLKWENPACG